jgi:methionyl-tRNA formyltransferase
MAEMFDTIIILAGPGEQIGLAAALHTHNPRLGIRPVQDLKTLLGIDSDVLKRARLIGFATPVIVPAGVLAQLGYGAYNFHPGPPNFPGLNPAQFAVYKQSPRFGVTAHKMAAAVDSGPIVDLQLFDVSANASVEELEFRSYRELARLFWKLSQALATLAEPLPERSIQWSGEKSSRRSYAALCDIPPDISKPELDRRIAAFGGGYFGMTPTVSIHGHEFRFLPTAPVEVAPRADSIAAE